MRQPATVVLDVGKTSAKVSAWSPSGEVLARYSRSNEAGASPDWLALDVDGIETFFIDSLARIASSMEVAAIIPIAHGAAAVLVDSHGLAAPPLDYEFPLPAALVERYRSLRDPFAQTGSPPLPDGLNLGAQLYFLQTQRPDLFAADTQILPWPQYWSWLLSGVAASEVTSLGCHTDLWQPASSAPSALSVSRGWHALMAPLQTADAQLGTLRPDWARRTGLAPGVRVHCGLHDSNAALLAARAHPEIAGAEATVVSTGTWFVAMRTPAVGVQVQVEALNPARDCLMNVDAFDRSIPSARFMGGREIELLDGRCDVANDQQLLLDSVVGVLASGAMVLPTYAPGTGPYPHNEGRWLSMPDSDAAKRTAVALYAALVVDAALDLIGAREQLLIEGRFGASAVFTRALASLRPATRVYVCEAAADASFGALSLLNPALPQRASLTRVAPLPHDLEDYRRRWRALAR